RRARRARGGRGSARHFGRARSCGRRACRREEVPGDRDAHAHLSGRVLALRTLEIRALRNLAAQSLDLHPRFNVFAGENGQGKTNTLEAVYLATTSRSFRTSALGECVAHGSDVARVRILVDDGREAGAPAREQVLDIDARRGKGRRSVLLHGRKPRT